MRVLWFANTPSNYSNDGNPENGGGWVSALETQVSSRVELAVSFLSKKPLEGGVVHGAGQKVTWAEEKKHGVTYFPVYNGYNRNRTDRFKTLLRGNERQLFELVASYLSIIEEFKPDVIQVFGSEHSFGLVAGQTDVPVVLHVQGLLNEYYKVFLPPGVSWRQFIFDGFSISRALHKMYIRKRWIRACERENRILRMVHYFLGRTEWDHEQVRKVNPDAVFFEGGEIMRAPFYDSAFEATGGSPSRLTLVTTISEPTYKGYDLILRTAKLLRDKYSVPFEWRVFGNVNPRFFEKVTGIDSTQVGVRLEGVAEAETIASAISKATMYVHPSYIDNSPNGLCEAQLLGAAVVATNVGGVPSLIDDCETGFLVRKGNPEDMAERIVALYRNKDLMRRVGQNARKVALERHDRERIVEDLMKVYGQLTA